MKVRYLASGMYHYSPLHQLLPNSHLLGNGFNVLAFHIHTNLRFTSTFLTYHQTATQSILSTLSKDQFYTKQRYFQRM
jgi:hypothetical protein